MPSLYLKGDTYYISVQYNGIRKTRSLKTKDISVAKQLKSLLYYDLVNLIINQDKLKKLITAKKLSTYTWRTIITGQVRQEEIHSIQ